MAFSPKRAKLIAEGKVSYCVYVKGVEVFRHKNLIVAMQQLDCLLKTNSKDDCSLQIIPD